MEKLAKKKLAKIMFASLLSYVFCMLVWQRVVGELFYTSDYCFIKVASIVLISALTVVFGVASYHFIWRK